MRFISCGVSPMASLPDSQRFSPQAAHSFNPAVVVARFALNVRRDLGVRQHQEALTHDRVQYAFRHVFGTDDTVHVISTIPDIALRITVVVETDQPRGHGLGADQANLDAVVPVRDGQGLGKSDRGVLAGGVGGLADLAQQARS